MRYYTSRRRRFSNRSAAGRQVEVAEYLDLYLGDLAQDAAESHRMVLDMVRNGEPIPGIGSGDVAALFQAANIVRNLKNTLKHYR